MLLARRCAARHPVTPPLPAFGEFLRGRRRPRPDRDRRPGGVVDGLAFGSGRFNTRVDGPRRGGFRRAKTRRHVG